MSRDEFMEATVDVWEIPPERASRVGHPAPFPVALPERLIHMNSYAGDLVLDPFMGSGTTAVAAVRTGRHYIGYDTDAGYVEAARHRIAKEALGTCGGTGGRRRPQDRSAARWLGVEGTCQVAPRRGRLHGHRRHRVRRTRCGADAARAVAPTGAVWWFEVVGGRTSNRPGAQRIELLWRAISKAAIVREVDPSAGFVVLTVDQPAAGLGWPSAGGGDRSRSTRVRGGRHALRRRSFERRRVGNGVATGRVSTVLGSRAGRSNLDENETKG